MPKLLSKIVCLAALAGLAGCVAPPPPPPPMLVAMPGPTKTAQAFAQDDVICRAAQPSAVQPGVAPATGATLPAVTPNPDTAAILPPPSSYLQCMQARGNVIQSIQTQAVPSYYAYPSYYYGSPWWGWGPGWGWGWGGAWGWGGGWGYRGWGYGGWGHGWGYGGRGRGWGYGGGWGRGGWGGGGWHGGAPFVHGGHP